MHQVKLNNILLNNVFFTNSGKNTICVDECKEEFFGVYNLKIQNQNVLCEGKSDNLVYCDVSIDNKIHKNIPFHVLKSKESKVSLDRNTLEGKGNSILTEEKKTDVYEEIVSDLDDGYRTKEQLVEILKESQKEKKDLTRELIDIKKQIKNIQNKKEVIVENTIPDELLNYKQEILKEFFKVTNENEYIIDSKFENIREELQSKIDEFSISGLDFLKKQNSETIRETINELYQEISESNSETLKSILEDRASELEERYNSKLKEQIDIYSDINSKLFESVESAKKDTQIVLNEQIENFKKESLLLEEKKDAKLKEQIEIYSDINSKLFESVESTKKEIENIFENKISSYEESILGSFNETIDTHNKNFSEEFVSKFEKIIKDREEEIKNKTNGILNDHGKNLNNFLETRKKDIIDSSEKIIQESNKKVKDLEKKVENLTNQLNKSNSEKKRIGNLLEESKRYADTKIAQALEESKRFTRIMMDMVGGGSGSVAVQYAAGGTVNGDLTVNGNLNTGQFNAQNTILSGGNDLSNIFAGEGEGDTNALDGGII